MVQRQCHTSPPHAVVPCNDTHTQTHTPPYIKRSTKQLSTENNVCIESTESQHSVCFYTEIGHTSCNVEFCKKKPLKERPAQFRMNRLTSCRSRGVSSLRCHEIPQLLWEIQPVYGREGMLRHDLLHPITGQQYS